MNSRELMYEEDAKRVCKIAALIVGKVAFWTGFVIGAAFAHFCLK